MVANKPKKYFKVYVQHKHIEGPGTIAISRQGGGRVCR